MTVTIPCTDCAQCVPLGVRACPACGRRLSSAEQAALEARFEAMNSDYREAKTLVFRGLAAALVAGLVTITIEGVRLTLAADLDITIAPMSWLGLTAGVVLVAAWFTRTRAPAIALTVALGSWLASTALPLLLAPAQVFLGLASAGGVVLSIVRLAVFLLLIRGLAASIQMRRLLISQT